MKILGCLSGPVAILAGLMGVFAHPVMAGFTEQQQFGTGSVIPLAWGDYDSDGDLDMAVGHTGAANKLFVNNGDGTYTEQSQFANGMTFAVCWGDYDNDGDLDLAVGRGNNQQNLLFTNNGNGTFSQSNQFGLLRTTSMAWGDADNDGDLDLAVGNGILGSQQQSSLYVNNGDGTFTGQPIFGVGQTVAVAWGDADGDGDLDLAAGRGGYGFEGQNALYINSGNLTFTERPEFGGRDTAALAWGDYDNDGDLDMAVGNWAQDGCALYTNQGDGTFVGRDEFGARFTNTISCSDFDGDGDLDVAVGNGDFATAEQNYLYINQGAANFTETAQLGLGSTNALVWGDHDLDGDLDVAASNEDTGARCYLYVNESTPVTYLKVHLVGHRHDRGNGYSNRNGVGAKVAVYEAGHLGNTANLLGYREVSAHAGFSAQDAIDPYFGLPGRSVVDVRITWPGSAGSRIVQSIPGVAVNQTLLVDEAPSAASVNPGAAGDQGSLRLVPNPLPRGEALTVCGSTVDLSALRIVSPSGAVVRSIPLTARSADGSYRIVWDGHTADGNPAAAGVYMVRLDARDTGRDLSARLVLLR